MVDGAPGVGGGAGRARGASGSGRAAGAAVAASGASAVGTGASGQTLKESATAPAPSRNARAASGAWRGARLDGAGPRMVARIGAAGPQRGEARAPPAGTSSVTVGPRAPPRGQEVAIERFVNPGGRPSAGGRS